MQNIKKFLIFSIIMFPGIECLNCDSAFQHAGENAAKILAPAVVDAAKGVGVQAAQVLAPAVADAAKSLGSDAAIALANSNLAAAQALAPAAVDAAKGIGVDAVTALADSNVEIAKVVAEFGEKGVAVVGIIGIIWASADSFTKLRPISKEIYEYYCPTEEQIAVKKANTIAAKIKLNNLKAEENFLNCIMKSKSVSEKNASGCPIACEEAAILFATIAGEAEVDRMVTALNKYRK